jgi:hypothetical protein
VAKRNLVLIALSALRVASCESNQCGTWGSFAMCVVDVRLRRDIEVGELTRRAVDNLFYHARAPRGAQPAHWSPTPTPLEFSNASTVISSNESALPRGRA